MHVPSSDVILSHPERHSPVVVGHARAHAADVQLRIADAITRFAGSMLFVYIHILCSTSGSTAGRSGCS
jgi:uncharacterized membrane protein